MIERATATTGTSATTVSTSTTSSSTNPMNIQTMTDATTPPRSPSYQNSTMMSPPNSRKNKNLVQQQQQHQLGGNHSISPSAAKKTKMMADRNYGGVPPLTLKNGNSILYNHAAPPPPPPPPPPLPPGGKTRIEGMKPDSTAPSSFGTLTSLVSNNLNNSSTAIPVPAQTAGLSGFGTPHGTASGFGTSHTESQQTQQQQQQQFGSSTTTVTGPNPFKNTPLLPTKTLGVPKAALLAWYSQKPRSVQVTKESYITWNSGAKTHDSRYTGIYVCPLTAELFWSGRNCWVFIKLELILLQSFFIP